MSKPEHCCLDDGLNVFVISAVTPCHQKRKLPPTAGWRTNSQRRILMLKVMRSRGLGLMKMRKRRRRNRTRLVVKGQRADRRIQSRQKTLVIKTTKAEHLVTHLRFQRNTVSVVGSLLRFMWTRILRWNFVCKDAEVDVFHWKSLCRVLLLLKREYEKTFPKLFIKSDSAGHILFIVNCTVIKGARLLWYFIFTHPSRMGIKLNAENCST